MFRRSHLILFFAAALLVVANIGTYAQSAPVSGTVELDTNGVKTPVAGALIEVYRTDIKSGFPSNKTGKDGRFSFAGLQIGGVFAFAVSAPGCSPTIFTGVRAGQEKLPIIMTPGDGKKYTEAEVREYLARKPASGGETGELTPEQKKAQAENEAKRKEVEARNAKAMSVNEIVNRTLKAGIEAMAAKNYDLAIASYTEGIDADPNFVGAAPVLLNNRAIAYRLRGLESYNKNVKSTDAAVRAEGKVNASNDLVASAESFLLAFNVIKNAAAADIVDAKNTEASRIESLVGIKETCRLSVLIERSNQRLIEIGKLMLPEYITAEAIPAKKAEAMVIMADMYRISGDFDNAIPAYREVLAAHPDQPEALGALGLCLVGQAASVIPEDKQKMQEGLNYMQKFTEIAPVSPTDSPTVKALKESVKETVEYLRTQKMAPQKLPPTPKKKP